MHMCSRVFVLLAWTLLCPAVSAAAALATPEEDRRAKQALPPEGKAFIFVYRDQATPDRAIAVWREGRIVGRTAARTFLLLTVPPGRHRLASGDPPDDRLVVHAEAGRNYFVRQEVQPDGRSRLRAVAYAAGRRGVMACRLVRAEPEPPPRRAPPREPVPPSAEPERFALIAAGGALRLRKTSQSILGADIAFKESSSGVVAVELEYRPIRDLAVGLEVLRYSNDLRDVGTSLIGDVEVTGGLVNVKKYFRPLPSVRPYVGAGLGAASADFSGVLTGRSGGAALQVVGGLEFRWPRIGLYTQVKWLTAKTEDSAGQRIDLSARGVFAGLSVHF